LKIGLLGSSSGSGSSPDALLAAFSVLQKQSTSITRSPNQDDSKNSFTYSFKQSPTVNLEPKKVAMHTRRTFSFVARFVAVFAASTDYDNNIETAHIQGLVLKYHFLMKGQAYLSHVIRRHSLLDTLDL